MVGLYSVVQNAKEPAMGKRIGLVVVDHHPVMRYGICSLINAQSDFEVLGDAEDIESGIQLVKTKKPNILLIDVEQDAPLSTCSYISTAVSEVPNIKVMVYTANLRTNRVFEAIERGVSGYVIKTSHPGRLFEAIRLVSEGGFYLDAKVASVVTGPGGPLSDRKAQSAQELTPREMDVLNRLVSGKRNKEIAAELFISERTVKFHIRSMFNKLQANSRTGVVRAAIDSGLI